MRVCAARRGAASPAPALPPPPRPPRREGLGGGPGAAAGGGEAGPWEGRGVCGGVSGSPGICSPAAGPSAGLSERQPGRQPVTPPPLPRADETRDLPGGEQPPTEEDGGSAPSRGAGAFHGCCTSAGLALWFLVGGGGKRSGGISTARAQAAAGSPGRVCPRHLPAGRGKGETNLISVCVGRRRRPAKLDPHPLQHLPAWPGERPSQRCARNGCEDRRRYRRWGEGQGASAVLTPYTQGPHPASPHSPRTPRYPRPVASGSRLQEERSPQPAGRCLLKEETPAGDESQGKCCLPLAALPHKMCFPPTPAAGTWINKGKASR